MSHVIRNIPEHHCCADAKRTRDGAGTSQPKEDGEGSHESCHSGDEDASLDSFSDDDEYVSDRDSDDEGLQKMLRLLEEDNANPDALVVQGKRRRTEVNYRILNAEMFGDLECYEGEGMDDDFQEEKQKRRRKNGKN